LIGQHAGDVRRVVHDIEVLAHGDDLLVAGELGERRVVESAKGGGLAQGQDLGAHGSSLRIPAVPPQHPHKTRKYSKKVSANANAPALRLALAATLAAPGAALARIAVVGGAAA
jgi:hypothetical protein